MIVTCDGYLGGPEATMFPKTPRTRKTTERPVNHPSFIRTLHRDSDDRQHEAPVLRRTSRFRADEEADDSGHVYLTARYLTRFE